MSKPGKIVKIVGTQPVRGANRERPARMNYAQVTDQSHTTMGEAKFENVFIPDYDRPGYLTDNAARTANGKMFKLPLNRPNEANANGMMPEGNLGE